MTGISLTAADPTNFTAVAISLGIVFIVGAVIAVVLWSYFQLQSHRADAVAMAAYRKLAEDAVANQQELRAQLTLLTDKVQAVEQLMREVG
jgi:predicted negative regulator of RcsB-dependent stress response